MQNRVSFFLTVLFIFTIVFTLSPESKAQEVEEKIVVVKGTDDWKNTRIRLYPNDKVTIRATGEVCFSTGYCEAANADADGWNWNTYPDDCPGDNPYCDDPMRQVNHAALIGNVGSDDFFIGKDCQLYR